MVPNTENDGQIKKYKFLNGTLHKYENMEGNFIGTAPTPTSSSREDN